MFVASANRIGIQGIQNGMNGLRRNAAEIASARQIDGSAVREISEPLLEQARNVRQVEASAKVLRAADDMVGWLFHELA